MRKLPENPAHIVGTMEHAVRIWEEQVDEPATILSNNREKAEIGKWKDQRVAVVNIRRFLRRCQHAGDVVSAPHCPREAGDELGLFHLAIEPSHLCRRVTFAGSATGWDSVFDILQVVLAQVQFQGTK